MSEFIPVNGLEIHLRNVLRDRNTKLWTFYTPLAAYLLWIIVRRYPELDGSDEVAPPGKNPELCTFSFPSGDFVGIYTAKCRAEAVMKQWDIPSAQWQCRGAPGFQVLRFVRQMKAHLNINCGLKESQYGLDRDMVDILLSRPEPKPVKSERQRKVRLPEGDPQRFLGTLREFLARQPGVRAAWIFGRTDVPPQPPGHYAYELLLAMRDPEDDSLLHQAGVMAKALTPVEMDWVTGVMMGDDESLRRLAAEQPPFYRAPDFLARHPASA